MAIASNKNTPRNTYTATAGQTDFTIGFEFFKVEDVKVFKNGTQLTFNASPSSGSQFKITGTASASDDAFEFGSGGTVTLGAGASVNDSIVIIRDISIERTSDFPSVGAFDITALNTQLDTLTSMVSDIKQQSDRSVKLSDTDTVSATITLPAKATRQDKLLSFDSNGNLETTTSSSGLAVISSLSSEITALGAISSDLTNLNSNISTLTNLNTNLSAVTTVNSNLSAITTNNANATNINTVASANTNITNVANALGNINQVAGNLTGVTSFADIYLGAASSNPTTDADGSALEDGDLYFNTTSNNLRVFSTASGWQSAGSVTNGTSARFTFTVSGTPTTISGNDDSGNALQYDANFMDVYLNGVKQINGTDVTITSGNSIVFASALTNGDIVDCVAFGTFQVANINAGTAITAGTLPVARGGTGLSSLAGNAGKALLVNGSANGFTLANASSAEVYGFNMSFTPSTIYYNVAVQSVGGANKYFIMGTQQKTLELEEGNTYIFDHPSAHPLRFSTDSNNSTPYTTGVTVVSSTRVQIVVATNAPTLYYYCNVHAGMGGQANTPVPFNNNVQVTTTNQGADDIDATTYAGFDDVLFSASGFTFSLNNGDLIATI